VTPAALRAESRKAAELKRALLLVAIAVLLELLAAPDSASAAVAAAAAVGNLILTLTFTWWSEVALPGAATTCTSVTGTLAAVANT